VLIGQALGMRRDFGRRVHEAVLPASLCTLRRASA